MESLEQDRVPPGRDAGQKNRYTFASRMAKTPRSFIREILKVTERPEVISFAGGLPNPDLIDAPGIQKAAEEVLREDGRTALQYSTTEGYLPLRKWIAERYRARLGLSISPEEILITNGSQQCLDLLGRIFLDPGDAVAIERPGYLGAIQAFSLNEPVFCPVPLHDDGPDLGILDEACRSRDLRFFYGVPNSQNPSGISYPEEKRRELAEVLLRHECLFIEDDAYGELRFDGKALPSLRTFAPDQTIITGSFSKILSPGMRLGWVVAPPAIREQLVVAKQAADLHSNYLSQRIAYQYLTTADLDGHVRKIRNAYREQCGTMTRIIAEEFPEGTLCTHPAGGMFVWLTLPGGLSSMEIFSRALENNVAVLPGLPFYVDGGGGDTLRLNFSNASCESIREGMGRLARVLQGAGRS